MLNSEALKYYRITEASYKHLDSDETPFMNLGLWPASGISHAQENLVRYVCQNLSEKSVKRILELGPGWGGSRKILGEILPQSEYVGLNCSSEQIAFSSVLNSSVEKTKYVCDFFENLRNLQLSACDTVIAIESLLHVKEKNRVIDDCVGVGMKRFAFAEICIEDKNILAQFPLFRPSLSYTWTTAEYAQYFANEEYCAVKIEDISEKVFGGWSEALNQLDDATFRGNIRVLSQFRQSYLDLYKLSEQGLAKYIILTGEVRTRN